MDWIERYRIDPEWFNDYEQIFKLIESHDLNISIAKKRDYKISTILSQNPIDPLEYLNPILDSLQHTITKTLMSPTVKLYYIDSDEKQNSNGRIYPRDKNIMSETMIFKTIEEFAETFSNEEYNVFPYLISKDSNGYSFRGWRVKKEKNIKWLKF